MARVKGAMMTRKRRNKILKLAKGYWGAKSKHFKMANEQVMKSLQYDVYRYRFLGYVPLPVPVCQFDISFNGREDAGRTVEYIS